MLRCIVYNLCALFIFLSVFPVAFCRENGAGTERIPVILTLYSYHSQMPWSSSFRDGLQQALNNSYQEVAFYEEFLDAGRFSHPGYNDAFYNYLMAKYQDIFPDIVLASSKPARHFMEQHPDLFNTAHRIIFQTDDIGSFLSQEGKKQSTVNIITDFRNSITNMQSITAAQDIYVLADTLEPAGENRLMAFREAKDELNITARIHYLINIPMDELLLKVETLPAGSAIYYLLIFSDMRGKHMTPYQVAGLIAEHANAPVFSHWQSLMGSGILGGYQISGERIGQMAGRSVLAYLHHQQPEINSVDSFHYYYDWQQLQRWDISPEQLPEGSTIINRPEEFWSHYGLYVSTALFLTLLISVISFFIYRNLLICNIREHSMRIANTDILTGLYNRRGVLPLMNHEMARVTRFRTHACLLMIDIDHFKDVNDQYGHTTGDAVLKFIAHRLANSIRKADTISRWGGEEFIVLTPATPLQQATGLAEKLREIIASLTHVHGKSVTISIGVSEYRSGESFDSWCDRADKALYQAKNNGRNRVVAWHDNMSGAKDLSEDY